MICTLRKMAKLAQIQRELLHSWILGERIEAQEFLIAEADEDGGRLMVFAPIAVTQLRVIRALRILKIFAPAELAARATAVGRCVAQFGAREGSVLAVSRAIRRRGNKEDRAFRVLALHREGTREELVRFVNEDLRKDSLALNRKIPGGYIDTVVLDLTALHRDTLDLEELGTRQWQQERFAQLDRFDLKRAVLQEAL